MKNKVESNINFLIVYGEAPNQKNLTFHLSLVDNIVPPPLSPPEYVPSDPHQHRFEEMLFKDGSSLGEATAPDTKGEVGENTLEPENHANPSETADETQQVNAGSDGSNVFGEIETIQDNPSNQGIDNPEIQDNQEDSPEKKLTNLNAILARYGNIQKDQANNKVKQQSEEEKQQNEQEKQIQSEQTNTIQNDQIQQDVEQEESKFVEKKEEKDGTIEVQAETSQQTSASQISGDEEQESIEHKFIGNRDLLSFESRRRRKEKPNSLHLKKRFGRRLLDTFGDSLRYVNKIYTKVFGKEKRSVPAHMPHYLKKSVINELHSTWPGEYERTSASKFRAPDDMQFSFSLVFLSSLSYKLLT